MALQAVEDVKRVLASATDDERARAKQQALKNMRAIQGHLVTYPLYFLLDEVLDSGFNIEALLPGLVYQ